MATVSFNKQTKPAENTQETVTPQSEPNNQVAVRQEQSLGPAQSFSDFSGSWSTGDIKYPRVNLVHKTSAEELITKYGIGSFILNKEAKLSDGKTPLTVIALHVDKDLVQKLPYGDPTPPLAFRTPQEVVDNGGTLNRKDSNGTNLFIPRATITLAIPAPEGLSEDALALFPYDNAAEGNKPYAIALYTVSSSAYTSVGKELATLRTQNKVMRKGLLFGSLALTSEDRKDAKNNWKVPVIKFTGENPAEVVSFLQNLSPAA